jgi:hypothetical protein
MASSRKALTALNEKDNLHEIRSTIRIKIFYATVALFMMISGCAPHKMYREADSEVYVSQETDPAPESECEKHALQQLPTGNGASYLLGFIEFNDQGQLWKREQMNRVLSELRKRADKQGLLMVVFAHGWKHSAAPGDTNIKTFRGVLAQLSDAEAYRATPEKPARQVAGIYLGWRGGSIPVPYLENITFWDRKNTAQKVGYGGVAEVLSRLEEIKATSKLRSRLVVVGHSFGGAVVHTALAQILENRFIQTTGSAGQESTVKGFGNLVVLINPAFEANLFTPLSDMAVEKSSYHSSQLPVMAVLTSEADWATGIAFPIGRWFSTRFENEKDRQRFNSVTGQLETISEHEANITAVGHFEPYRTHYLSLKQREQKREDLKPLSTEKSIQNFRDISRPSWTNDQPGSIVTFDDVILTRTKDSAGHNPYLMIYVDKELISGHNDIDDERVIEFIKQLIMVSSDKQN